MWNKYFPISVRLNIARGRVQEQVRESYVSSPASSALLLIHTLLNTQQHRLELHRLAQLSAFWVRISLILDQCIPVAALAFIPILWHILLFDASHYVSKGKQVSASCIERWICLNISTWMFIAPNLSISEIVFITYLLLCQKWKRTKSQ